MIRDRALTAQARGKVRLCCRLEMLLTAHGEVLDRHDWGGVSREGGERWRGMFSLLVRNEVRELSQHEMAQCMLGQTVDERKLNGAATRVEKYILDGPWWTAE